MRICNYEGHGGSKILILFCTSFQLCSNRCHAFFSWPFILKINMASVWLVTLYYGWQTRFINFLLLQESRKHSWMSPVAFTCNLSVALSVIWISAFCHKLMLHISVSNFHSNATVCTNVTSATMLFEQDWYVKKHLTSFLNTLLVAHTCIKIVHFMTFYMIIFPANTTGLVSHVVTTCTNAGIF